MTVMKPSLYGANPRHLPAWSTDLRRLSTESYVMNSDNPVATKWTWYWEDENEDWKKYDITPGVRIVLEKVKLR